MIEARGLTKQFGALPVLRGVDLAVAPGRVTAIIGPNGAGKTTFLKMILGLTRPGGGTLLFDGHPVNGDCRYRARIGYMPQLARFPENLTGRELIAMVRDLRGAANPLDDDLIAALALEPQLDKRLRTLSGGTRQKINAVLAVLFRPDLLILDEPTAGLDPVASSVLKDKILALRGRGVTCLITSHVLSELEELADDVVFLLDGRVRFAGAVAELKRTTRQVTIERAVAEMMRRGAEEAA
ncbi:MAG TPA: ABC transporter ATP-binding protein [Gemmatimonadaceae bacterium]|nr:ABC transporter ATP-binding protein [Gemmatimonadaceae bacterium]